MKNFSIDYSTVKNNIISCTNCRFFTHLKFHLQNKLQNLSSCYNCPNYLFCSSVADKIINSSSPTLSYNASVRYEPNGLEVVFYKKPHSIIIKDDVLGNVKKIDTSRLFRLNSDNHFEVCKDGFTFQKFYNSITNSRKKSLQKFYNYGLANTWEYFITLTFSPEHVDRYDCVAVKEKWSIFQTWLKRHNPDAKILVVPEFHDAEDDTGRKALHFHGFLSNVPNLTFVPAVNAKTGDPLFSKYETNGVHLPLLNIKDWKYGYSTADVIVDCNNLRICNYIIQYMFKSEGVGYQQKSFYNTRNLDACFVDNCNIPSDQIDNILSAYGLETVKDNEKFTVFRSKR